MSLSSALSGINPGTILFFLGRLITLLYFSRHILDYYTCGQTFHSCMFTVGMTLSPLIFISFFVCFSSPHISTGAHSFLFSSEYFRASTEGVKCSMVILDHFLLKKNTCFPLITKGSLKTNF